MKSTLSDRWREISAWLDDALDLDAEARRAWLENLDVQQPESAAQVRAYLDALEQLEGRNFLGIPAADVLDASLAGHSFGAYTLDREIGHGGMGTVWLAHRSDGRFAGEAAVKLLNTALVRHPSARRFTREGQVLARLQHPNIAHLLDAGIAAGSQPYLILEYVRGERIDQYCDSRGLDLKQRIQLFLDVLSAVAHAHSRLIIHRDLKPSNILVTDEGVVKLLDFGIAALLSPEVETSVQLTRHFAPALTPGYAAPEQLLGEAVTTATDVYALGVVLCLLLAGRHPLGEEDRSTADLMRMALDRDAPRPSEIATNPAHARALRGDLDNIVCMALRRNPAERYATADQLAQDLRRYLAYEPVSARPRSSIYLTRMFVRRHRAAVGSAFAIAVTLVGAVILTTGQMLEARQQRDRAQFESRQAEASRDFLNHLFMTDLGPGHPMNDVYERLNAGVEVLDKQYRDNPRFHGRMLADIGTGFTSFEDTRRASELLQQAYDIGRASGDVELMVYAQCLRAQSEAYADVRGGVMNRLVEAERLLAQVKHPSSELRAGCLIARSKVESRLGDSARAEALLLEAKRLIEEDDGTHRQTYVNILSDLGTLYNQRNQPRDLLRMALLSGEIHERNGRGSTYNRLIARQNAAGALHAMGETRAALAEHEIINSRLQQLVSPAAFAGTIRVNYAHLLVRMGRATAALEVLEPVLARARTSGHSALLTMSLYWRGAALAQLDRREEAEAALREAATLVRGGIGNRHMGALIESTLARLDLVRGDADSARAHGAQALQLAGYRTDRTERSLARVLLVAADVALARGVATEGERFARDSLAISERHSRGADTSSDVGEGLLRLARAQLASHADARPTVERALRCLTNGYGPDHPLTLEARQLLSEINARVETWSPRLQTDGPKSVPGSTKRSS